MKYFPIILIAILSACSNNNGLTTQLLNRKKTLEDSLQEAKNLETYYIRRAKTEIHEGADSLKWSASADSSGYFFRRGRDLKNELKNIEFSIDSISKMK